MTECDALLADLKWLRETLPPAGHVPSFNERVRTMQNVGGFILRAGRLDAIIDALSRDHGERTPNKEGAANE